MVVGGELIGVEGGEVGDVGDGEVVGEVLQGVGVGVAAFRVVVELAGLVAGADGEPQIVAADLDVLGVALAVADPAAFLGLLVGDGSLSSG